MDDLDIIIPLLVILLVGIFVFYVILSFFLNKYHLEKYKQRTILSWVPIIQLFILGKLVFNKWLVIFLVIMSIFALDIPYLIKDRIKIFPILSEEITLIIFEAYKGLVIVLIMIAFYQYFVLKYGKKEKEDYISLAATNYDKPQDNIFK